MKLKFILNSCSSEVSSDGTRKFSLKLRCISIRDNKDIDWADCGEIILENIEHEHWKKFVYNGKKIFDVSIDASDEEI
jgi:hypothetical protein